MASPTDDTLSPLVKCGLCDDVLSLEPIQEPDGSIDDQRAFRFVRDAGWGMLVPSLGEFLFSCPRHK